LQSALKELVETVGGWRIAATAATEMEATEWLHQHPQGWELAVVDLLLQDGSGFGLIQRCRSAHPQGRIVVFSEYASPALKQKCSAIGADAVFLKSELPRFLDYIEAAGADCRN
jgi:DNA-binding NarL/FixJ family response regulator